MHNLIYLFIILTLMGFLAAMFSRKKHRGGSRCAAAKLPFRRKDYLLTKAERSFYETLLTTLQGSLIVFPKVRLLDLVWLPKGTEHVQSHRNTVQSKHVDFVLCDRQALKPLLVIELNDASHDSASRKERDQLVANVLAAAGIAMLTVRARQGYVMTELRRQIEAAIATPANAN